MSLSDSDFKLSTPFESGWQMNLTRNLNVTVTPGRAGRRRLPQAAAHVPGLALTRRRLLPAPD